MIKINERRTEHRLEYYWPIWFTENLDNALSQGEMLDISSRGAAFSSFIDGSCPYRGQRIIAYFSVPLFGLDASFEMANFTRSGRICRVQEVHRFFRRVVLQFAEPLSFKPGEQGRAIIQLEEQEQPAIATV